MVSEWSDRHDCSSVLSLLLGPDGVSAKVGPAGEVRICVIE